MSEFIKRKTISLQGTYAGQYKYRDGKITGKKSYLCFILKRADNSLHTVVAYGDVADVAANKIESSESIAVVGRPDKEEPLQTIAGTISCNGPGQGDRESFNQRNRDYLVAEQALSAYAAAQGLFVARRLVGDVEQRFLTHPEDVMDLSGAKVSKIEFIMDKLGAKEISDFLREKIKKGFLCPGWKDLRERLLERAIEKSK